MKTESTETCLKCGHSKEFFRQVWGGPDKPFVCHFGYDPPNNYGCRCRCEFPSSTESQSEPRCPHCGHDFVATNPETYDCRVQPYEAAGDPVICGCDNEFHRQSELLPPERIWIHTVAQGVQVIHSKRHANEVEYVRADLLPTSAPDRTFTLSEALAVVGNVYLNNGLWDKKQDEAAACIRDRISAAFKYAAEGRDYRHTSQAINAATPSAPDDARLRNQAVDDVSLVTLLRSLIPRLCEYCAGKHGDNFPLRQWGTAERNNIGFSHVGASKGCGAEAIHIALLNRSVAAPVDDARVKDIQQKQDGRRAETEADAEYIADIDYLLSLARQQAAPSQDVVDCARRAAEKIGARLIEWNKNTTAQGFLYFREQAATEIITAELAASQQSQGTEE